MERSLSFRLVRIYCLDLDQGRREEYTADLKLAIERGWIEMHESGTYVKFTQAGADLFA